MLWKVLEAKSPKQLLNTLRHWHWTKQSIITLLVCCEVESEEVLNKMTYLEILTKYQQEVTEAVEEECSNA